MKFNQPSSPLIWLGTILGLIIGYKVAGFFGIMIVCWLLIAYFFRRMHRVLDRFGQLGGASVFSFQRGFTPAFFQVMGYVHGDTYLLQSPWYS